MSKSVVIKKKTKAPPRKVVAENFVMKEGDEEYYPHYDESVWFAGRATVGESMQFMALQEKYSNAEATEANAQIVFEQLTLVCEILARAIIKWDWTDNNGDPYPENPTLEDIRSLSPDEVNWLMTNFSGAADPEARKND